MKTNPSEIIYLWALPPDSISYELNKSAKTQKNSCEKTGNFFWWILFSTIILLPHACGIPNSFFVNYISQDAL